MRIRVIQFAAIAMLLFSFTHTTFADTITQNFTIPDFPVSESQGSTSLFQFDPSLGTLNSVSVQTSGGFSGFAIPNQPEVEHSVTVNLIGPLSDPISRTIFIQSSGEILDGFSLSNTSVPDASIIGTGQYNLILTSSITGTVSAQFSGITGYVNYDYTPADAPSPVPEPSTIGLVGSGFFGAAAMLRRRMARS